MIQVVETTATRRVSKAFDRELRQVVSVASEAVGDRDARRLLDDLRQFIDLPRTRSLSPMLDAYLDGDRLVTESPWVEGVDLLALLQASGTPGLPVTAVLGWLDEVGEVIRHLKAHGMVHGAIRPANLVLNSEQRIVVIHLGSAVLDGIPSTDSQVDVRGVAVTAAALLTGTSPTVGAITGTAQVSGAALQRALLPALADHGSDTITVDDLLGGLRQELNAALPTGVVTFLLTDIVGSTRQWEVDEASMATQLARHDLLMGEAVEAAGGRLLKARGEGDATFSVFTRASAGVIAAVNAQARLRDETDVVVRMAIHTGEAELREADYFGRTVNRAARLRSVAPDGGILLSAATADLVIDAMPKGTALVDRGTMALKDLERAEHVYQIAGRGLAEVIPDPLPLTPPAAASLASPAPTPVLRPTAPATVDPPLPPTTVPTVPSPAPAAGRRRLVMAVGAVLILGLVIVGALVLGGGGDEGSTLSGPGDKSTTTVAAAAGPPIEDVLLTAGDLPAEATDRQPLEFDNSDEPCGQQAIDLRLPPTDRAAFSAQDEAGRMSVTEVLRRYSDASTARRANDLVMESFSCATITVTDASGQAAEGAVAPLEPMEGTEAPAASYTELQFNGLSVGLGIAHLDEYQVVVQYGSLDLRGAVLRDKVRTLLVAALGHLHDARA